MPKHDWDAVAAEAWQILVLAAPDKKVLSYAELARLLNIHHRNVRHPLDRIQNYCLDNKKPPLVALVVNKQTGLPGKGFAAAQGVGFEEIMEQVASWPWADEANPFDSSASERPAVGTPAAHHRSKHERAVLLAWNPTRWNWSEYDERLQHLQEGKQTIIRWSCGNTKSIQPGERALLVRVGQEPRGLIATGTVVRGSYEAVHWDSERAAANDVSLYVDMQLDRLANPGEVLLHRASLSEAKPSAPTWSPQGSGVHIASEVADAVEALLRRADAPLAEEVETAGIHEGATRRISVNSYERSAAARQACIDHYGSSCTVCDASLAEIYGPVAKGHIHVHHLVPLSQIGDEYVVDPIKDLRPVCPNCHAIIHLGNANRTIAEVRELIHKAKRRASTRG